MGEPKAGEPMKNVYRMGWFALLAAGLCIGCGEESDGDSAAALVIEETGVAGTVNGQAWTMTVGFTKPFLSDETSFRVELFADDTMECGSSAYEGSHIILAVPTTAGEYAFGPSLNGTFVYTNAEDRLINAVSLDGRLVVDEVTDERIRGGVVMTHPSGHRISGQFDIAVCPDPRPSPG